MTNPSPATPLADEIEPLDELLEILLEQTWISSTTLAAQLGTSQASIASRIRSLRDTGLEIQALPGKGHRLSSPIDLLDAKTIRSQLTKASAQGLDQLIIRRITDSTNTLLLNLRDNTTRACLAEYQTAGRGRAGRSWFSPFASNLHLSVKRAIALTDAPVSTVSLAIGVAVAETLTDMGVANVGLKWPNDLWIDTRKLGGILVEARPESRHALQLVIGLGLNIAIPPDKGRVIDQPWTHLADHLADRPARGEIAGRCLDAILGALREFERDGFGAFADRWAYHDHLAGHTVNLIDRRGGGARQTGIARGVAPDGGLIVDIGNMRKTIHAGDISLRIARRP